VTNIEDLLSHQSVLDRSKSLVAAAAEVHRSFELGRASGESRQSGSSWEAWRRATPRLHAAMETMYPEPLWGEVKAALRSDDSTAREAALVFLEVDPWCFRSGYEKADLMKGLAHLELSTGDQERVRRVVLHVIQQPHRRELPRLVGLAASVWGPRLETDLDHLERGGNDELSEEVILLRHLVTIRLHEASRRAAH
jgi:hypothetical protein